MRVFFSHSSRDNPWIREIQRELSPNIKPWIDERELLFGGNINSSIKSAITQKSDFVVIFIGPEAVDSEWVQRELKWALRHENTIKRIFVVPVLLDEESWKRLPAKLQGKKYLLCTDFTESAIKDFTRRLENALLELRVEPRSFTQEEEYAIKRREVVKGIAKQITDDQEHATDQTRLTRDRLKQIVSSLESIRKVELLCLFELQFGKAKDELLKADIVKAHLLKVEVVFGNEENLGRWTRVIDWTSSPFHSLQVEWGLGDKKYEVRDVFLKAIGELSESERKELFSGIEITRCSFER